MAQAVLSELAHVAPNRISNRLDTTIVAILLDRRMVSSQILRFMVPIQTEAQAVDVMTRLATFPFLCGSSDNLYNPSLFGVPFGPEDVGAVPSQSAPQPLPGTPAPPNHSVVLAAEEATAAHASRVAGLGSSHAVPPPPPPPASRDDGAAPISPAGGQPSTTSGGVAGGAAPVQGRADLGTPSLLDAADEAVHLAEQALSATKLQPSLVRYAREFVFTAMENGHDGVGALFHLVQTVQVTTDVSYWASVLGLATVALRSNVSPALALSQALMEYRRRVADRAIERVSTTAAHQQQQFLQGQQAQLQQAALLLPDGIPADAATRPAASVPGLPTPTRQLPDSLAAAGALVGSSAAGG
eukprot:3693054-Prymnesium_polylepis.1